VTCGGLCPGFNVVIREIVMGLYYNYEVRTPVLGVKGGYSGFYSEPMIELTPQMVVDIHLLGGSILKSSRTALDLQRVCDAIQK
jgi:6-phosphofructokinase 1